ncbi:Ig-like domain-containing protein [Paraburkholderia sp. RL18-085-BIA-A]|uniref:Ig-like domain-containing protein n=1 Tax=Paraburkholderia sp. RL18-085-BIA-A TaxID=3031633 RepID=UPI0038BA8E2A
MSQPTCSSSDGYISEQFFTLHFDVTLDAGNPPPTSAFDVQINGTGTTVTGVTVDSAAKTVIIAFSASVLTAGDIIEFSYTDPTAGNDANAIQGTDGTDAATFSSSTIVSGGRPGPSAPPTPTVASGSDSGALGDGFTSDSTPTLIGTAAANATIKLYDTNGTTLLGTATADGAGHWSITSSTLSDGSHALKVTQTDGGNSTSPLSTSLALTIDTSAAAPTSLAMASGSDSGTLGDGITNVGTPVITGHAEANAPVRLYDTNGTTVLGSATADGSGNWSITSSALATGVHTLTAQQTDVAGNVSPASSGFTYTLDTVGPTGMGLSATTVQMSGAANGATVATLSATDATAIQYGFAVGNGTIDADNGKFSISGTSLIAAQNLAAGTYHIYVKATDAAGNDAFQIFSIDVVDAPGITSIERAASASATVPTAASSVNYTVTFSQAVTGVDASDFALTTTGNAGGTIASVSGSGDSYTVTVAGISGDGTLRLDLNGSGTGIQSGSGVGLIGGAFTSGQTFTLDHTAPSTPAAAAMTAGTDSGSSSSDAITSNTTPVFIGTSEANATVKLYDTDGTTVLGTATADGSGNWNITSSTLSAGSHTLTVKQTDAAGNVSAASNGLAVVIDTSAAAPVAPTLASDSGKLGDGVTNAVTPTITGTAEANASVTLYDTDGTTVLGTATADSSGAWSIVSSTLDAGSHTLTVMQTDLAGNVSAASTGLALTIDTSAPVLAASRDSGALGDNITNFNTPILTGTAEAGATVTLYDTNGTTVLGTATANGSGNWSITSSSLGVGVHTLTADQTDLAGNVSAASAALALTIEAPPAPPANIVDGVVVTITPVTLPGGSSSTEVEIPIVTGSRVDSSGNPGVADIPLVTAGSSNLLLAQLAPGYGLTASGGPSHPAGNSLEQLIEDIQASTPGQAASDQAHLTGNAQSFQSHLPGTVPLLIETIVPVSTAIAPIGTLTLTGTSTEGQHMALVIDTQNLAAGSTLELKAIDFAAIVGTANIIGSTAGQILTGDSAPQHFTVSSGAGSSVFAGGGNDVLQFVSPAASATHAAAPGAASTTMLDGGAGVDTAVFNGARSDYTVQAHDGYIIVSDNAQPQQQVVVINVENLQFADVTVAVDNRAALTSIAGLYQDVLGRQADLQGFNFWGQQQQNGVTLGQVALDMISSAESQAAHPMVFNGNPAHDIQLLYQGIFGRAGDPAGVTFWINQMHQGLTLAQVADDFVHAPEMNAHNIAPQNWDFVT